MELLFVYGTLKRGYRNNQRALSSGAEFLGVAATTTASYGMLNVGFPLMFDVKKDGRYVRGEIFKVNDKALAHCDGIEGHPDGMYRREKRGFQLIRERTGKSELIKAWVYLWQREQHGDVIEPQPDGTLVWGREGRKVY